MRKLLASLLCWGAAFGLASAQTDPCVVRVVDVGAGLCCVVVTPDGRSLIYDAGNFVDHGLSAMTAIEELIPLGSTIDLLVVSHSDADHWAAIPFICENYTVAEVWREGLPRDTQIWKRGDRAIRDETASEGCRDVNLQTTALEPGHALAIGQATATFICGFDEIPESWGLNEAEDRNARSIVIRFDYGESSILFCGDTVGRHVGDPAGTCLAAEAEMVARAAAIPLAVDVVVAPHHGADNASSRAFVRATSPDFVIFSCDSKYHHPHREAAGRYLSAGVPAENLLRTDRGDNEGTPEWRPRAGADPDKIGDDDVEVRLEFSGEISAEYRAPRFAGLNLADARELVSPQMAKWALDESLWTESFPDLEAHTQAAPEPADGEGEAMDGNRGDDRRSRRPWRGWRRWRRR